MTALLSDKYDDVEFMTQGGMARVYRARRKTTNRVVAVREIPGGTDGEDRIESERHGAEIQRALCAIDRRVPTVYDVSTSANGWLYVEMELIDGEDLADRLQHGPLPAAEAVRIAREVFDFLRVAHGQSVVVDGEKRDHQLHGDLTPRNVRIGSDGTVRILDFGIAKGLKATVTAQAFANFGYISPERARTGRMGLADDYWSAGVLLYEMLAGTRAFPGSAEDIRTALALRKPPLPLGPHVPRPLRLIVSKLLAWDPAFRYASVNAVLEDLTRFSEGRRTQAEAEEEDGRTRAVPPPLPSVSEVTRPVATAATVASPAKAAPVASGVPAAAVSADAGTAPMPGTPPVPAPRRFRRLRMAAVIAAGIIVLHENDVWGDAEARARIAATERVDPDRLWSEFQALRERAWFDVTTRSFGRVVAGRLMSEAVTMLRDYREDLPTIRRQHFEAARTLLARAARIEFNNGTARAWLRYTEAHLARLDGEEAENDDRRSALLRAVSLFEEASRLAPQLPDPHIALALIYTYYIRDPDRARRAMSMAEERGHPPGQRGHAQLGDLFRTEGEALIGQARVLYGTGSEEPALVRARAELMAALDEYDQARGFAQSARNARQAAIWIRSIDSRLAEIRAESALDAHAQASAEEPW